MTSRQHIFTQVFPQSYASVYDNRANKTDLEKEKNDERD